MNMTDIFKITKDMDTSNFELIKLLKTMEEMDPKNEFLHNLYNRHDKYTPESLVQELREDASNTIFRPFIGSPSYREIVAMVAEKMDIKKDELGKNEEENELLIIRKMIRDYMKEHPDAQAKLNELIKEMGDKYNDFTEIFLFGSSSAFLSALEILMQTAPIIVYDIVMQILIRAAGLQTALIIGRIGGLLVPFLNIVMGTWMIITIAGPAYRKIVPSVIYIALIRIQIKSKMFSSGSNSFSTN